MAKVCSLDGCNAKYFAGGYCEKHYARVRANGDPNLVKNKGRPSKYHPMYADLARRARLLGMTFEELASHLDVTVQTLYNWMDQFGEFFEAIKDGGEKADAEVTDSLFMRAMGYTHDDERIFCQDGEIIRAKTKKHYPPETAAAIFFLKNRQPNRWKDKKDYPEPPDPNKEKTLDELKAEAKRYLEKLEQLENES